MLPGSDALFFVVHAHVSYIWRKLLINWYPKYEREISGIAAFACHKSFASTSPLFSWKWSPHWPLSLTFFPSWTETVGRQWDRQRWQEKEQQREGREREGGVRLISPKPQWHVLNDIPGQPANPGKICFLAYVYSPFSLPRATPD